MKALVVYVSRHGSTRLIAEELSSVLTGERFDVRVADAREDIGNVTDYDVVIVGSAIQMRSWLKDAKRFVRHNAGVLRSRPVWLFSSGLRADDQRSADPSIISEFRSMIVPRDHHFFPGSFDPKAMGWMHRAIIKLPGFRSMFPVGDFRDWNEIRSWAKGIAEAENGIKQAAGGRDA
jgi:menaquinone-dependent protoporphyrinogen oxidase